MKTTIKSQENFPVRRSNRPRGAAGFAQRTPPGCLEWCKARHLSRSTYRKLKNLGLGPKELEIPGMRIKRITPEADAEWEARMAELAKGKAARLEAERRRELATIAGQIASSQRR